MPPSPQLKPELYTTVITWKLVHIIYCFVMPHILWCSSFELQIFDLILILSVLDRYFWYVTYICLCASTVELCIKLMWKRNCVSQQKINKYLPTKADVKLLVCSMYMMCLGWLNTRWFYRKYEDVVYATRVFLKGCTKHTLLFASEFLKSFPIYYIKLSFPGWWSLHNN